MDTKDELILIGGAIAAFYLFRSQIGSALTNAPANAVVAAGSVFGLPATNVTQGAAAFKAGNYLQASKLLPAADFIKAITSGGASLNNGIQTTIPSAIGSATDLTNWMGANGLPAPAPTVAATAAMYASDQQWPATPPDTTTLPSAAQSAADTADAAAASDASLLAQFGL